MTPDARYDCGLRFSAQVDGKAGTVTLTLADWRRLLDFLDSRGVWTNAQPTPTPLSLSEPRR